MDTSKISDVLIFKDGHFYLSTTPILTKPDLANLGTLTNVMVGWYIVIEPVDFKYYGINRNGFEFASDAYAYLASLQEKHNTITLDMKDGLQPGDYYIVAGDNKLPEVKKVESGEV